MGIGCIGEDTGTFRSGQILSHHHEQASNHPVALVSPYMNRRPGRGVGVGLAQDLAGHGGDVSLAEDDEAGQVLQWVALGPAEVGVRLLAGPVADGQQRGGQPVGDGRALDLEHPEPRDLLPLHLDVRGEVRGVFDRHLEEEHGIAGRDVARLPLLPLLDQVLPGIPLVRVIGDQTQGAALAPPPG